MIHRLVTVPLNGFNFQKELNIIKQIAINNFYNVKIINKILNHKLYRKAINLVYPFVKENKTYSLITYIGQASNNIARFFAKLNLNIAFKLIIQQAN